MGQRSGTASFRLASRLRLQLKRRRGCNLLQNPDSIGPLEIAYVLQNPGAISYRNSAKRRRQLFL